MTRAKKIELVDRVIHSLMFGALFVVIGFYLPRLASSYLPSSYYYTADITLLGQGSYKPCETIQYMVERNSRVSSSASFYDFLVYKDPKSGPKIVWKYQGQGTIENTGEGRIFREITIPCNASPGTYTIQRQVAFEVDHNQKVYEYNSQQITVSSD